MSATKQDYAAIAAAIREARPCTRLSGDLEMHARGENFAADDIAHRCADHFARNPKFDRAQFLRDCGIASPTGADAPLGRETGAGA